MSDVESGPRGRPGPDGPDRHAGPPAGAGRRRRGADRHGVADAVAGEIADENDGEPAQASPRLPPSRRRLLVLTWAVLTFGLAVRAFASRALAGRGGGRPMVVPVTVDANRASIVELATLPGIGPQRAEAIVLHRVRFGPFRAVEDLDAVDGIGPETIAELAPFATFAEPAAGRPRR